MTGPSASSARTRAWITHKFCKYAREGNTVLVLMQQTDWLRRSPSAQFHRGSSGGS